MAKKMCVVCGKELGILSLKTTSKDGTICNECFTASKIKPSDIVKHDSTSIKETIVRNTPNYFLNKEIRKSFIATKNIGKYLYIDENSKRFMVGKDGIICDYSDLVDFELLEDGESIIRGGVGSAIAGGLLFGGVGALIGATIGSKKSKSTCDSMDIKLIVKNTFSDTIYIRFIGLLEKGIKTDSIIYQSAKEDAHRCLSALQIIASENKGVTSVADTSVDTASEISKFHELMKNGIITEDEFNAKKTKLLGL